MKIHLPAPETQVRFAAALAVIRRLHLQDALAAAVTKLSVKAIDGELAKYVTDSALNAVAAQGLRGELVFPVPLVLGTNPQLLQYYRLLYGYSEKQFFGPSIGLGRFKAMETRGEIREAVTKEVPALVEALCGVGERLIAGLGGSKITPALLDDLTLLTLGAKLRGSENVSKGTVGIETVFNLIYEVVKDHVADLSPRRMVIAAATGRKVYINFASDPDITITEEMQSGAKRNVVAIEVKAGTDFSNIHNRLGEAEKSHIKAKKKGHTEFWTVVNVDQIDLKAAANDSPSTSRFYRMSDLLLKTGDDFDDFRDRINSFCGL